MITVDFPKESQPKVIEFIRTVQQDLYKMYSDN